MAFVRRRQSHRRTPEKTQAAPERFSLRVTAPLLVFGCVILALTLGWAFFTGFLVGRGENPGERLASLAPFGQKSEPEVKATPKEEPSMQPEETVEAKPAEQVKPIAQAIAAPSDSAKPVAPAHPFTRPDTRSMAAWGVRGEPSASEAKPPEPETERFEYQLRLATFAKREEAEALMAKITGKHVRCKVVPRGKHFVVQCVLRGTEQHFADFQDLLGRLKVKDPFLAAKKELKGR